ncbi:MAG: AmmeMemoRadiSam system protein B [Candidatus Omnitrophica bacterium]|nr:AmmeMemoRadiSam system protein B [Candidatus Omnitrophota bacterium]
MGSSKVRKAVVAGRFYPDDAQELKKQISSFIEPKIEKCNAQACVLPHAGYTYSGRVAIQTLAQINIKDKIVLLGPNHTGNGVPFSIMTQGSWVTPLGSVDIDTELAEAILKGSKYLESDSAAHLDEHSLEVELPILQYFKNRFKIVPIAFMSDDLSVLKKIGQEIAQVIVARKIQDDVLLAASSDMTHYESQQDAEAKDKLAIEAILELNPDKLFKAVKEHNITMCGYAPVIVMLSAVNFLGAKISSLVKYQTSGDVTGDRASVVGYAGIIVK